MRAWLRRARAYLYTGTQPAPYTLGLLEAGMTGVPIVSIGPAWMASPELFEAPELVPLGGFDDPAMAKQMLAKLLSDTHLAQRVSAEQREFFIQTFGKEAIARQWADYLAGVPAPVA